MKYGALGNTMRVNQIPLNNVVEDTQIVFVNATTLKINDVYYIISGSFIPNTVGYYDFMAMQKLTNGYIQSITYDGTNYSLAVLHKYTQNNASWCDLGYVDVSSQYTNETVTNPIAIDGTSS